jgi:hypothetical protein
MPVIYSNNASTTLSAGINNSTTTISIASATGFPTIGTDEYYFATIANTNNTKIEVVKVTAGTTSLTVTRAQDGTTAQAFDSGDNFQLRVTAATLEAATKTDVNIDGGSIATAAIDDDAITAAKLANSINTDIATGVTANTTANAALPKSGGAMTGAITSAGDLSFDVASDIVLDADGGKIKFRDAGSDIGYLENSSGDLLIKSITDDKDIKIQGKDGGSFITACTFDMSNAGAATFNSYVDLGTNNIYTGDNGKAVFGSNEDLKIYHDGSNSYITEVGTGNLDITSNGANVSIMGKAGENSIVATGDGSVELYYDNTKKFETTSSGVSVTGDVFATGAFGKDSTDKIQFSDNTNINFVVNGNDEMRLEADGDLHVDGDVIAYSTTISDERLKDNIEVVDGALDKVKELKGVTFTRKQDGQKSAGVIAQDVEKVLPEAVKHKALPLQTGDDELFKTVQYDALHALLIESIKELSARVEELESK